jgi:hypothetical protein
MKNLDEINKWVSKLSTEEIQNLTDEEILSLAMERPGHPGQYGFMLQLGYFESEEHLSMAMYQLMERLHKVEDLEEKMKMNKKK